MRRNMRVTTQMLNQAAQKAGLPVNRSSLLNYINGNNSSAALASALSKTRTASDTTKIADYEKLEKSADQAEKAADKLLSADSEDVTTSDLQTFVDRYNEMLKELSNVSDTLNKFYAQTAKDTVKEYRKELAELGITTAKDGTLSFDKAKFEKLRTEQTDQPETDAADETSTEKTETNTAADIAAEETEEAEKNAETSSAFRLKALFDKEDGLFSKLSFLFSRISDNANANAESYSGCYNASGAKTNAYSNGRYSFRS